jgi:uncharacterized protein YsxB (DUF464 family)
MISVNVTFMGKEVKSLTVSGHAGSDEYGKDLVCAGVSTAVTGVCNTLAKYGFLDRGTIEMQEGYVCIETDNATRDDQLILETLMITLACVEESNGQYIHIKYEEE